jgi:hypothetical protein
MTKNEAHELLDRQKRGFLCLPSEVNQALWVCGDTRTPFAMSSERMEDALHETNQPHWETQSIDLVARYSRIDGEEAWEAFCG